MFPRPFHCWKSFWFGILVLVFLACSWTRSIRYHDAVSWGENRGGRGIALHQRNSEVSIIWKYTKSSGGFLPGFHLFRRRMNARSYPSFPRAITWRGYADIFLFWTASIAHWLLILIFLIPWTVFLLCRARRLKRLARQDGS